MATFTLTRLGHVLNSSGLYDYKVITSSEDNNEITRWTPAEPVGTAGDRFAVGMTTTFSSADASVGSGTRRLYNAVLIERWNGSAWAPSANYVISSNNRTTAGSLSSTMFLPTNLLTDTRYRIRFQAMRERALSDGTLRPATDSMLTSRTMTFWTNRTPAAPVIDTPSSGATVAYGDGVASALPLSWTKGADDDGIAGSLDTGRYDDYGGWEVQVRPAPTVEVPNPAWQTGQMYQRWVTTTGPLPTWTLNPNLGSTERELWLLADTAPINSSHPAWSKMSAVLPPGTYQFRVRTFDWAGRAQTAGATPSNRPVGTTSPWSNVVTLYVIAPFLPPLPLSPANDEAVEVGSNSKINFCWQFRDPRETGGEQKSRRVSIREAVGDDEPWYDLVIPVSAQTSDEQCYEFFSQNVGFPLEEGKRYEWRVETTSTPGDFASGWSESAFFFTVPEAGSGPEYPESDVTFPDPGLGCGDNRVFLYRRGGIVPLGEITDMSFVQWARERDEISQARVVVPVNEDTDAECKALLALTRSWLHEIVVFRDNGTGLKRVWEGPVTRVTYRKDEVEIAAHDVMVYVYRRIMRQGYNDSYRVKGRTYYKGGAIKDPGVVLSRPRAVTLRSATIMQNALAYDDPNVLRYMTVLSQPDDAKQSRIVPDYSRSAWQQVDDLAAKSGLDYTVVGRRTILWDTHNSIGTLPEMRDGDFDDPPVVTEYGMQAANVYGTTNNSGVYGLATAKDARFDDYGYIEMINSAWGEDDEGGSDVTLTAEAREELEDTLAEQASRNIGSRWPVPVIVRVPDNSTLSPDVQVGINQLVPGVHIPLRSDATLRSVAQMQKLDRVVVQQDSKGERVQVTLSPAPRNRNDDPDSGGVEV